MAQTVNIKFVNCSEVLAGLISRKQRLPAAMARGAQRSLPIVDRNVKALCPVDTGKLKGSYHGTTGASGSMAWIEYGSDGAFAENGYNYAIIQEKVYRPHLAPGFYGSIPEIIESFKTAIISAVMV